jgi:hypothetical protein
MWYDLLQSDNFSKNVCESASAVHVKEDHHRVKLMDVGVLKIGTPDWSWSEK